MQVQIPAEIFEEYLPPRCRKKRTRRVEVSLSATIREVHPSQAPVAVMAWQKWNGQRWNYRHFSGMFWKRAKENLAGSSNWMTLEMLRQDAQYLLRPKTHVVTREAAQQEVDREAQRFLIVGGDVYQRCGEPMYLVMTFGLGHNHGGTALMDDERYNSNIGHTRYFNLNDRKAALAAATKIAKDRGDTKNLPIKPHTQFRVLLPKTLTRNPAQDHGDGDPFINQLQEIASASPNLAVAGALILQAGLNAIDKETSC